MPSSGLLRDCTTSPINRFAALLIILDICLCYNCRPQCDGQSGLTGQLRKQPAKIVMMFLFSYEVDVLEIMLHESIDSVDKIVIVESSVSHRGVSSDKEYFQELNGGDAKKPMKPCVHQHFLLFPT